MSFSKFFLIYIISLIYLSYFSNCHFVFPFDTIFIKDKTINDTDYFTNLTQNELYINFSIGAKEENIKAILKMDKYGFLIYENAYNYGESTTYEIFYPDVDENIKTVWVRGEQIPSKDILYLPSLINNKYEIIKTNKTKFLRVKQEKDINYFNEMFYTYGIIGLKYNYNPYFQAPEFVKSLKASKDIDNETFYLTFEKDSKNGFATNNNKGKFFVGKLLHKDKTIYSESINYAGELFWGLNFAHIYLKNKNDKKEIENIKTKAEIIATYPYLKAPKEFFNYIEESFFNTLITNNLCYKINFMRHDISLNHNYYSFACNSESKDFMEYLNNNFPDIIFEHIKFKEQFILTKNDLFAFNTFNDKDKYLYFLIVSGDDLTDWILGTPFLKKYVISYNYDSKLVGYYADYGKPENEEEEKSSFFSIFLKVVLIIALVVVIFILGMLFQKIYKRTRKKKANELDDEFEYEPQKDNKDDKKENIDDEKKESLGINE